MTHLYMCAQVYMVIDETNYANYRDASGFKVADVRNIKSPMFISLFGLSTEPLFIQNKKHYRLDANVNPKMGTDWFQRGLLRPDLVRHYIMSVLLVIACDHLLLI